MWIYNGSALCYTTTHFPSKHTMVNHESIVSFVSRRYMRGENRKDSLMVCLSVKVEIEKSKNELFQIS